MMDPFRFEHYVANLFRRLQIYGVPQGVFVATTRLTPPAIKLATGRGIRLIDDTQLALLIRKTFTEASSGSGSH